MFKTKLGQAIAYYVILQQTEQFGLIKSYQCKHNPK